jgi:hypothetical protein
MDTPSNDPVATVECLHQSTEALSHALLRRMLESDSQKPSPRVTRAARAALEGVLAPHDCTLELTITPPPDSSPSSGPEDFDDAAITQAIRQTVEPNGTVNPSLALMFLQNQVPVDHPQRKTMLDHAYGRILERTDEKEAQRRNQRHGFPR